MTDKTLKELCEAVVSEYEAWDRLWLGGCKARYYDAIRTVEERLGMGAGSIDHASTGAILSAINEAEERAQTWQPIETAPKDGTWILVLGGLRPPLAVHWLVGDWVDSYGCTYSPQHWMPLPEAP
jgi:hypothetical protein